MAPFLLTQQPSKYKKKNLFQWKSLSLKRLFPKTKLQTPFLLLQWWRVQGMSCMMILWFLSFAFLKPKLSDPSLHLNLKVICSGFLCFSLYFYPFVQWKFFIGFLCYVLNVTLPFSLSLLGTNTIALFLYFPSVLSFDCQDGYVTRYMPSLILVFNFF